MQLHLHQAQWSEVVKMDCCSAGHNHAEINNQEKKLENRNFPLTSFSEKKMKGGSSWFVLIMILLMASLLIFSILK